MNWTLVTGAPCADIGKGSLCAALARQFEKMGSRVAYQKLEPCLQRSLADIPNGAVGEIIRLPDGRYVDFDVARVLFYAPSTTLGPKPDLSLWHCINEASNEEGAQAPRIVADIAAGLSIHLPDGEGELIVEVGGSLGEAEHRILLDALVHALGRPNLHMVIGAIVQEPSGRRTTKPIQLSLRSSPVPPDVVLLRGARNIELATLEDAFGSLCQFTSVREFVNAVEGYLEMLSGIGIFEECPADATAGQLKRDGKSPGGVIAMYGDVLESRRYESLALRIDRWSNGRVKLVNGCGNKERPIGVILVGASDSDVSVPVLRISTDNQTQRPDWRGTADDPEGPLAEFLRAAEVSSTILARSAYTIDGFAREYIARSRNGQLKDHDLLDPIIWSLLPPEDQLQSLRILDIGCGYGRWTTRLLEKGVSEVVGIEPSPQMYGSLVEQQVPGLRLLRANIEDAVLEGYFDVALALMSLDHVVDLPRAIQLVADHLRPHGRVIITTEHPWRTCTEGARWRECPTDSARRQGIVENYHDEGPRTYTWFGRGEPVVVQHRTVETWIRVVRDAGLNILSVREPVSLDPRDGNVPRYWVLCAELPLHG